jgi:RimJ/RimL family protein N-acetyltransferase
MFPDLFRDDVFTLETPRLFLRWPKASDAANLVMLANDRRIAEAHAVIPHPYTQAHAVSFITTARTMNTEGNGIYLAIAARREPRQPLGVVSLRIRPEGDISLGYWLGVAHWGKGHATEAAQAILDAAFLYTQIKDVIAEVRVTNDRSRRVLKHCGFQYEGSSMCARPAWGDSVPADAFRLTRSLWSSLKGWRAPIPFLREGAAEGL